MCNFYKNLIKHLLNALLMIDDMITINIKNGIKCIWCCNMEEVQI